ncbi:hypothetical protein LSM04_003152 [Trypanosoma melophagium]|uniref:uncharacterized protein n=1 Tax=Trypanosoma melophagium TaxID=715481 RepID=UPI00351A7E80|nr:hypothetical protein LSM04_003152 [Trypanosoma melophagium]
MAKRMGKRARKHRSQRTENKELVNPHCISSIDVNSSKNTNSTTIAGGINSSITVAYKLLTASGSESPRWDGLDAPTLSSAPLSSLSSPETEHASDSKSALTSALFCNMNIDSEAKIDCKSNGLARNSHDESEMRSFTLNNGEKKEEKNRVIVPPQIEASENSHIKAVKRATLRKSICAFSENALESTKRETTPLPILTTLHKPSILTISVEGSPMRTASQPSLRVPQTAVAPQHWSVFYPEGMDQQPPVLLHYLVLGGWRTVAGGWDYFSHRRLQKGEVVGHSVRWLHSARPRDRFVFVITPVESKAVRDEGEEEEKEMKEGLLGAWRRFRRSIFGSPPAFACNKGKLFKDPSVNRTGHASTNAGGESPVPTPTLVPRLTNDDAISRSLTPLNLEAPSNNVSSTKMGSVGVGGGKSNNNNNHHHYHYYLAGTRSSTTENRGRNNNSNNKGGKIGVEVIEVRHEDITATDYSPRLLSSRFAMEAKTVYAYFFDTLEDALAYYGCLEDLQLIDQQVRRGVTNVIPCVKKEESNNVGRQQSSGVLDRMFSEDNVMGNPLFTTERNPSFSIYTGNNMLTSFDGEPLDVSLPRTEQGRGGGGGGGFLTPTRPEPIHHLTPSDYVDNITNIGNEEGKYLQREEGSPSVIPYFPLTQKSNEESQYKVGKESLVSTRDSQLYDVPFVYPRVMPTPTTVHFDTIVTVYSEDPNFNALLREVLIPEPGTHPYTASLKEQRRMLSMYETGMPAWTVFLASTGLPYRRVFRLTFVGLVNIWPVISLFVGLYDLYKHLPHMKEFVSTTLAPLLDWIERRVTLRISMLVTYLLSVGFSVAASFTSFFSQFYVLEVFLLPLHFFGRLLHTPFTLIFELLWTSLSIIVSFLSLLLVTLKMLIMGPFVLVSHLASLEFATSGAGVLPAAAEGTSLTMKWWRAWQEFWVTVASPVKNLAKAWYDSVVHVASSAARREASIRRWYTPKLRCVINFMEFVRELCIVNVWLWWQYCSAGRGLWVLYLILLLTCLWMWMLPFHLDNNGISVISSSDGSGHTTILLTSIDHGWRSTIVGNGKDTTTYSSSSSSSSMFTSAERSSIDNSDSSSSSSSSAVMEMDPYMSGEFDALHFAWETLLAVWIQLPW